MIGLGDEMEREARKRWLTEWDGVIASVLKECGVCSIAVGATGSDDYEVGHHHESHNALNGNSF